MLTLVIMVIEMIVHKIKKYIYDSLTEHSLPEIVIYKH